MRKYETGAYVKPRRRKISLRRRSKAPAPAVRITSGEFRGRELKNPALGSTHPMGSRERLALFNSLESELAGAVVLDAFAGTGAIGFEALSRGAAHVTFIEKDPRAAAAIKESIKTLGVEKRARVLTAKVEALDFDQKFDIVFADPPYTLKMPTAALNKLAKLSKKKFILSHPAEFDPHSIKAPLSGTKSYAAARISVFVI